MFEGLNRLQRDCVYKTLCFPVGVVACVAGLWRASEDRESCKDQAFFVDTTPQGSSVFMRDHHCAYSDLTMFHPSISLEEFTGEQIGLRVIIGRRCEPVDGKMRIELFDGGELTGELVNTRGVDSP